MKTTIIENAPQRTHNKSRRNNNIQIKKNRQQETFDLIKYLKKKYGHYIGLSSITK
ncbi:hypothetical protein QQ008_13920 [Fulvivirgaceae bacterium BMA10]|uniref:Uncharacterized protein n=1 Tax=Splendidivirga corallicola TaxID=3051826 RepID=A0ABT8KP18_9BACT|nr:hypothetical protein [Fulvivirgaceae bacterium BMA10]